MGKIDHANYSIDHRVADGDECVGAAYCQSVKYLLNKVISGIPHSTTSFLLFWLEVSF
ncbi:hypothetical protein [Endozoicomonas euniceicola]|uniref:2-oxoacid dehydrogenase acyltransferase catalytic domain-containing protein n=1 Tax=Endozoicomonas euniceicola TaxID=1234143 RepID=A0ABY6H3Z4_9GAMM|nr:hypothetical protein [Endozoicomonas euniceicola]UYM18956.1 hypothetical protein NX720_06520 [Endozoicomonas euniceicola]